MVEVTQEDRDAAADILDEISSLTQDDGIGQVADLIRDGEYDEHDTVQRTARHRQAGVQQGLDMAAGGRLQPRVDKWMDACFGDTIKADTLERCDRFTEEALELAQTNPAFTADRAHALTDYVFGRPVGEPSQEVGGVMITLAALCNASGLDMDAAAETELARIWTKVEAIRAKQASKPVGSALPVAAIRKLGGGDA